MFFWFIGFYYKKKIKNERDKSFNFDKLEYVSCFVKNDSIQKRIEKQDLIERALKNLDDIERFDKNDLLCYMVLCRFANNKSGECFPSYKTIAEKMRVGVSTAMKAIKSLADKGVIEITSRKNEAGGDTSNLYTIQSLKPNKKAPTAGTVEAQNPKKQIDNNIIPQNTKKDTKKENKNNTGKGASANVNNNLKYINLYSVSVTSSSVCQSLISMFSPV